MTLTEWLISKARKYWDNGLQVPIDLFAEMNSAGLDIVKLEKTYMKEK